MACPGPTHDEVMYRWIEEMTAFMKCVDPNHLVSGEGLSNHYLCCGGLGRLCRPTCSKEARRCHVHYALVH
jgi:endo-1,4-beta-mannosidase